MKAKFITKIIYPALLLGMVTMLSGCGQVSELTGEATTMIQELDFRGALAQLERAEEAGENQRVIDRSKGIAYMGLTEYDAAIDCFKKCLTASDGFVQNIDFDTNYYLAAAYTKTGRYEEAEGVYNAILALRSNEADAHFLRGNVRMSQDNYVGAKEDFDQALSMEPKNYDRLIEVYEVLANFGYKEAGQELLRNALSSGDKQMDNYVIGRIYYYLGEYQKAYLALEEAREKGGVKSYLYLGRSYEATGDSNYAASVYNSYLSKYEGNAEVYNQLGLCEMEKRDYRKALEAFQAGMKLGDSSMLQTLSFNEIIAYEYIGEFEQAKILMENYLKNYPDDETAKRESIFLSTR